MVVYTLEQLWQILRQIDLQKMPNLAKKNNFSDEAHFDLGWYVNNQNCRIWGTENPHAYIEKPTHPKRCRWCRFWSRGIIGPFFFENEQGEVVTVNGDCYRAMLNEFLFTKIEEEDIGNTWLMRRSSFWSWRLCKQAKLSHLGHRKTAHMHWKANAPKTSHCLVRILIQRHN